MIHFIVNPSAGSGRAAEIIPLIEEIFRYHNRAFRIKVTGVNSDVGAFTTEAIEEGAAAIIAVGGDGTVNEVVAQMADLDSKIPFGVLPGGSGNDFLRTFKGKKWKYSLEDVRHDIEKLLHLETMSIDLFKAGNFWVANMAIFGLGGDIAHQAELYKPKYGSSAYLRATLYHIFKYKAFPATITIDGGDSEKVNIYILCVGNGRFYGSGLELCLHARINNGNMSILLVEDQKKLTLVSLLLAVLRSQHGGRKEIREIDCTRLDISFESVTRFTIDGHIIESEEPITFTVAKDKINFLY